MPEITTILVLHMGIPTPSWAHTENGEFWKFAVNSPSFFNNSTLLRRVLILDRRNFYPGTANFQLATSIFSRLDVEFLALRRRFFKAETSRFRSKNVELSLQERRIFSSGKSNFHFRSGDISLYGPYRLIQLVSQPLIVKSNFHWYFVNHFGLKPFSPITLYHLKCLVRSRYLDLWFTTLVEH